MELCLERMQYRPGSTIGRLYVDGVFECFTLEDGIRTHKVHGETAIPAGRYPIAVNYSPRFKTRLPLLCDVPNFEGVRIHPGNTPANTLGCILVGRNWREGAEEVTASRLAFTPLKQKIEAAVGRGEPVVLQVLQQNAPPELAARAPRRGPEPAGDVGKHATSAPRKKAAKRSAAIRPIKRRARLENLALPPAQVQKLRHMVASCRRQQNVARPDAVSIGRRKSIGALFSGPSGTARTTAAAALATELGLELFRIDLGRVVSKHIGETEKNLERLFAAAKEARAVLLFDEADALFGKRSEVKDAHDRYANIDTDHLFRRIEQFNGVVILATRRKASIDASFTRRLRYSVQFPAPTPVRR